jgi:hypothetical protein
VTLPDRHRDSEAKERERKLVEYSDHRQHITLSKIYRAAVSFLRDKGHHIILEDTRYLEEHENDVDSEGFNDTPRLKIKMIEASNGQLFYFIDELNRKVMDRGGTIRINLSPTRSPSPSPPGPPVGRRRGSLASSSQAGLLRLRSSYFF